MVAMTAVQDAGNNLLAGLPVIRPETHGRYSLSARAALKFRAQLRRPAEDNAALTASIVRTGGGSRRTPRCSTSTWV